MRNEFVINEFIVFIFTPFKNKANILWTSPSNFQIMGVSYVNKFVILEETIKLIFIQQKKKIHFLM